MLNIKKRLFGKENKKIRFKKNIAFGYILMIITGAILLFLPFSHNKGESVHFVDAFFTSASAFSDTGLTTIPTFETFNFFGHFVIVILFHVGGIGLMTMKAVLFLLVNRKISTSDRMMIYTEQRQTETSGMVKLIKDAVLIMLLFQLIFTIIFSIHMMVNYDLNLIEAIWFSYFHATASITNAGFDLTGDSLAKFSTDYLFQIYTMLLIVVGGLGFPVLIDIKRYILSRKQNKYFRFTLFSKISFVTYFSVTIVGFLLILATDYEFIFIKNPPLKGVFYALFQVVSSRSSGLSTIDLSQFSSATNMILAILMFIGAAPASSGGGIRTTTLALIILYLKNYSSNKADVEVFNRRVPKETIFNAFVSVCVAGFMVFFSSLLIITLNPKISTLNAVFEVVSAFGTTGLSMGITSELDNISKVIITLVMIIGQIGITNAIIILSRNKEDSNLIRLPEENVAIG